MMVVQIVVDSLRADAPSYAGGEAATPALDELAAEGTTWPHLQVSGGWTVPSLLSMATGTFPHRLGMCRWRHPFPARRPSLMTAFAAAGFEVHVLAHNPQWIFGSLPLRGVVGDGQDPAQVVEALQGPRGRDRFVRIHHWWTHLPYVNKKLPAGGWRRACDLALESMNRHPEEMTPKFRNNYLRTIEYFSRELLGRYLDAATAGGEDALVVLTGDHGENWGESLPDGRRIEHIFDLHGRWIRDETARVPLVWWGKAHDGPIPSGGRRSGTVRGVDLAPTLADLAGIPWPGPLPAADAPTVIERGIGPEGRGLVLDGHSVAPALLAGRDVPDAPAMTVSSHNTHEPDVYPEDARAMWRTLARRMPDAWYTLDGPTDGREVWPTPGAPPDDGEEIFEGLREEWVRSVGPGKALDRSLFPTDGENRGEELDGEPAGVRTHREEGLDPEEEKEELARRMRTLGYLD